MNLLSIETSPYLLQHANNPVHWQAWNDTAWKQAMQEQKLVIVSVGYSACHWCHVMEHESFENAEIARIMNEHFVSIKVDREERPDVDQIYMDACQLLTGHGGWPLNAITLPDGRPIYAGTYFPKDRWMQVLHFFADYWHTKKEDAYERATQITKGIKTFDVIASPGNNTVKIDHFQIFKKIEATWDYKYGGRSGAPKFPMPVLMEYLLANHFYLSNESALKAVGTTLREMYKGGIYDHVGGGFARYSVDEFWEIPHFEKMLYDNAQLLSLYSQYHKIKPEPYLEKVVFETYNWMKSELSNDICFYSALDADSEGHEGKFYVWSNAELKKLLGTDYDTFCSVYKVSEEGNFEGHNHLTRQTLETNAAESSWIRLLQECRSERPRPQLDDKSLTAWNGLAVIGCTDAYRAFAQKQYLETAVKCANHLAENLISDNGKSYRNYKNSKVSISGFLDDYAFTILALTELYEVTFDENYLTIANRLAEYVVQHFYNTYSGLFFYTDLNDTPLIARKTDVNDNVIPSSNAALTHAFFKLGLLTSAEKYTDLARISITKLQEQTASHPSFYSLWARLDFWYQHEPYIITISGTDAHRIRQELQSYYLPNCIFMGQNTSQSSLPNLTGKWKENQTLIYLCKGKTCEAPTPDVKEILKRIQQPVIAA